MRRALLALLLSGCGGLVSVYSSDAGQEDVGRLDVAAADRPASTPSALDAASPPPYGPAPSNSLPDDYVRHPPPACPNSDPYCRPLEM